jgi:drug/metabolite transporter (DMT)-like permease
MKKFTDWFVRQPYLLLTLTAMFWSGNAIAGKFAVGHVSPALLTSMRWLFSVAIVLPFALPHLKKELPGLRPHLPFLFFLGSVGFAVFNNVMYLALHYTSAINVGILQGAMPLVVFVLNFALYRITTNSLKFVGFALTLMGIIITITNGNPLSIFKQSTNFGDLIMLVAIFSYGVYSVALRNKPKIHWLSFITILGCSAFITSLFFSLFEWHQGDIILPDTQAFVIIMFIVIFPSIIGQLFWIRGLELIGSNRGGIFINFVPIFSSIFAIILLGERFQFYHGLSLALVVGGVALAQTGEKARAADRIKHFR